MFHWGIKEKSFNFSTASRIIYGQGKPITCLTGEWKVWAVWWSPARKFPYWTACGQENMLEIREGSLHSYNSISYYLYLSVNYKEGSSFKPIVTDHWVDKLKKILVTNWQYTIPTTVIKK